MGVYFKYFILRKHIKEKKDILIHELLNSHIEKYTIKNLIQLKICNFIKIF